MNARTSLEGMTSGKTPLCDLFHFVAISSEFWNGANCSTFADHLRHKLTFDLNRGLCISDQKRNLGVLHERKS
jgi:hypothetical protein